jgi:catechol 2,3-dioxygenase-like lactoylglutathione lyase family enzyme
MAREGVMSRSSEELVRGHGNEGDARGTTLARDARDATRGRDTQMSRRELLVSLSAMALAPRGLVAFAKWPGQAAPPSMALRELNHFALFVADGQRSREFYQGLFGMPVQAVQGAGGNLLKVGQGMEYIALAGVGGGRHGFIDHWSINMENFDAGTVMKTLADHGVPKSDPGAAPMTAWIRMRGPAQGGAPEGTGELYFNDPDGIKGQVQDRNYCGGTGVLGDSCPPVKNAVPPPKAPITLRGLNHFTLFATNPQRTVEFYQQMFGMPIQGHQGAGTLLRIGAGPQFMAIAGGPNAKPGIDHFCMTMDGFDPDRVMKILADHGVAKGDPGKTPMTAWVRMREPELGGAPGGTPELYFNDPDGITVQLQDVSYCGGGGALGNVCR